MTITNTDLQNLDKRHRASLINCLSGPKAVTLIGTKGSHGENLALFNSVIHLGANPPLIGMISRPHSVTRHTLEHILETRTWTINHANDQILRQAHHTSAKHKESEFAAARLTAIYKGKHPAPFVEECQLQIACKYVNHYPIKENGTIFIIGSIEVVYLPEDSINEHGELQYDQLANVSSVGLNNYYKVEHLDRLAYAKP